MIKKILYILCVILITVGCNIKSQVKPIVFSLTYSSNGPDSGICPIDTNEYSSGDTVVIQGAGYPPITRKGYTFTGWNTSVDGSGTLCVQGQTVLMPRRSIVLYACWSKNTTYSITYNSNGADSGVAPQDGTFYEATQIAYICSNINLLTKANKYFTGWNTQPDASGIHYNASGTAQIIITNNLVLFAEWTSNPAYTITYNSNGADSGTIPADSTYYFSGKTASVLGNIYNLKKSNFKFNGWNTKTDGSGASYTAGQLLQINVENITLYVQWLPTYSVIYNLNGADSGEVPIDLNNYARNDTVIILSASSILKQFCSLSGWNTKADGNGLGYSQGQTFSMPTSNVILYAQWTSNPTYKITYDSNCSGYRGDIPYDNTKYQLGQTATISTNVNSLEWVYHYFTGWNTSTNGSGTSYNSTGSATLTISGNITLYAQWTSNPTYTLTYDTNTANSGVVPIDTTQYYLNQQTAVMGNNYNLGKTGCVFSNWNNKIDGTGIQYYAGSVICIYGNTRLYAQWLPTYSITYCSNEANSGAVPVDNNFYSTLNKIGVIEENTSLVKSNMDFIGWNTSADGTGTPYGENQTITMSSSLILYAQWAQNVFNYAVNVSTGTFDLTTKGYAPNNWPIDNVIVPKYYEQYTLRSIYAASDSGAGIKQFSSIVIPSSCTLKDYCFQQNINLTTVIFPNNADIKMGKQCFWQCESLTTINLPNGLLCLPEYTFYMCGLNSISIPGSVLSIDNGVFCWDTCSIILNEGLQSINQGGLGCWYGTELIIPSTVTIMAIDSFEGDSNLVSLKMLGVVPPTITYDEVSASKKLVEASCQILIPQTALVTYKNTAIWNSYSSQMVGY